MTIRDEINKAINDEEVSEIEFVRMNEWQWVLDKLADNFLENGREDLVSVWLWECLKEPNIVSQPKDWNVEIETILDRKNHYWFIASDEDGKYWVMSGTGSGIIRLLTEMHAFEYYILTKDLNSIVCENHHGYFIRKGSSFC